MNGSLKVAQGIVLLSFVGMMLSSCGGSQTTLGSTDDVAETPETQTPASSSTETIEDQEKNATIPSGYSATDLFVTIPDTIDYLNFSSIYGDWASKCTFTTASVVNDLTCNFEVNELALFKEGIKFQYNVPANSCKYIATYPYWYWNYEVGYGPKDISVEVTKDASGVILSSDCTVDGASFTPCTTSSLPDAANDIEISLADAINVKCAYDRSDEDGGVNCCFGKYRLRTTIFSPDGTTSTDERGKKWGGDVASCIGGPAKTSWLEKSGGYPKYIIEKMTPNVARTKIIEIQPTIDKYPNSGSNMQIANYFTVGKHDHGAYGSASGTVTSVYPYYIDPLSDRSGDLIDYTPNATIMPGSPHYIFDCLDGAFEVNNRIRVMVQEWDTVAALTSYISTGVSTPVGADEPGTAPADCPGIAGDLCNQLTDADNFVDSRTTGNYDNSIPSKRSTYFPNHTLEE